MSNVVSQSLSDEMRTIINTNAYSQNVTGIVSVSNEVEVKNDTGSPVPITGNVQLTGSIAEIVGADSVTVTAGSSVNVLALQKYTNYRELRMVARATDGDTKMKSKITYQSLNGLSTLLSSDFISSISVNGSYGSVTIYSDNFSISIANSDTVNHTLMGYILMGVK